MTETHRHASVWPLYLAAGGLGTAFLLTLLILAWDNAVESEVQRFGLESLSVDDTVRTNVQAAHDALLNLSRIITIVPELSDDQFDEYSKALLEQYPFIAAVGRYRIDEKGDFRRVYPGESDSDALLPATVRQIENSAFASSFTSAARTLGVIPSERIKIAQSAGNYLLVSSVGSGDSRTSSGDLLCVLINPSVLLGTVAANPALAVALYSESEGIGGRQQLFDRPAESVDARWEIDALEQSSQVRFNGYSMRLTTAKRLVWGDLGKALLFTALVLGVGVTLLLIALARAKELQARELLARNKVIEDQVMRQTQELAEARDQALEASRVKSDFLASMSHEIRTPLNAIIGMAELLSETRLSGDQLKYVNVFKNAGEALLSLVNDILDLSKIEAGQLVLEDISFSVRDIVEQSAEIYALKTDAKGVELVTRIATDVPPFLSGDPSRLRQVILNLIGNAIKFTDNGEIVVAVERVSAPSDPLRLLFSVRDTGIGIPEEKLESIFASFTQVDSSTTRKYGGTGLGLTISQKLVDKMNGRIWVESIEGQGSTFKFEVDARVGEQIDTEEIRHVDISGMSMLIVDDNETNRLILAETLQSQDSKVDQAASGKEALAKYEQAVQIGKPYELVLCDAQMPEMDGFEVIDEIVKRGGTAGTLMMLSSANLGTDLDRANQLGLGGYLVKPLKRAELLGAINDVLSRAPASGSAGDPSTQAAVTSDRHSRILLVEDNSDNRLLIKAYLKKQPYDIDEAENGEEAVALFQQHPYDLVLMDVQMPVMDGHEATRAIRTFEKNEARTTTPIIALTAHAIKEDHDKSIAAGCSAHLTKPIKKQTLINALGDYLD